MIDPSKRFPGQIDAPSADYPYGAARNVSSPGDGTGTPLVASWINDIWGANAALMQAVGMTPNNRVDHANGSQLVEALKRLVRKHTSQAFKTPEDFGAVGDGEADDTKAFKRWLQSDDTNLIMQAGSVYRVTSQTIVSRSGVHIDGYGATVLTDFPEKPGLQRAAIEFVGVARTKEKAVSSDNLVKGAATLKDLDDVSVFAKGDDIVIYNKQYKHGIDGVSGFGVKTRGEFSSVRDVVNDNDLALLEAAKDSYTQGNVSVVKLECVEDITVSNVVFKNAKGYAKSSKLGDFDGARALLFKYAKNVRVINCSFSNYRRFAVDNQVCRNVFGISNHIEGYDPSDPTNGVRANEWFTGFNAHACENVVFSGNTGSNCRRVFDADSSPGRWVFSRNILISNNVVYNAGQTAGTHACENVIVTGNTGVDSGAIWIRGINVTISNNRVTYLGDAQARHQGIRVGMGKPGDHDLPVGAVLIKDNVLESTGSGVSVFGSMDSLDISGNTVKADTRAVYLSGQYIQKVQIKGNTLFSKNRAVIHIPNHKQCPPRRLEDIIIEGNICTVGNYGVGISISGGGDVNHPAHSVHIRNNCIRGATVRGVGLTWTGSDEDQSGYWLNNIHVTGNTFKDCLYKNGGSDVMQNGDLSYALSLTGNSSDVDVEPCTSVIQPFDNQPRAGLSYFKGMRSYSATPANGYVGWYCTESGTNSSALDGAIASTVSGSVVVSFKNPADAQKLRRGVWLETEAGVDLGRVISISGTSVTVNRKASSELTDVPLRFKRPVFKKFGQLV